MERFAGALRRCLLTAVILGLLPDAAIAAITVDSTGVSTGHTCTLAQAIFAANRANDPGDLSSQSATTAIGAGTCIGATAGTNVVHLPHAAIIEFNTDSPDNDGDGPNALPPIASDLVIEGNGATLRMITGIAPESRFFYVGRNAQTAQPGQLTLRNLTMTGGRSAGIGGAIYNQGNLELDAVTLHGNRAQGGGAKAGAGDRWGAPGAALGGAIFNDAGALLVLNSTLTDNTAMADAGAPAYGGAIFNANGTVHLVFSTLAANTVAGTGAASGGAIHSLAYDGDATVASLTLENSILANSIGGSDLAVDQPATLGRGRANQAHAITETLGANLVMRAESLHDAARLPAFQLDADPLLSALANNGGFTPTMAPGAKSPAIDAAIPTTREPTHDQRGKRESGAARDLGAFEVNAIATTSIDSISPTPSVVGQQYYVKTSVVGPGQMTISNGTVSCTFPTINGNDGCNLISNTVGVKTITANHSGTQSTPPSSDTESHTVNQASTRLALPDTTLIMGAPSTITPVLAVNFPGGGTPGGTVNFFIEGALSCSRSAGGSLACPVTMPVDGEYTMNATYAGDANYVGSNSPVANLIVNPRPCTANDITLSTQAAVNAFQATYGPCTGVNNNLTIVGTDITDLGPLSDLVRIDSDLIIESNPALTSLAGLGNIKRIRNQLRILNNPELTSVTLGALDRAGEVNVSNAKMASLSMPALTRTTNQLRIENNPVLTSIALGALATVGTDLRIEGNAVLASLAGLAAIAQTGNQVRIINNPALQSVGLTALTQIGTDLTIDNNAVLTSLNGLAAVTRTGNQMIIRNSPALASVALPALSQIGTDLTVENNPVLTSLNLAAVTRTGNQLIIRNNPVLASAGFAALTQVGTDLTFSANPQLVSISMGSLMSTGGRVLIENHALLTSIGMSALTTIGTELRITGNSVLPSLVGLGSVVTTGNAVRIKDNPQLASIDLLALTTVAADLEIENNASLTSLAGLASATRSGSRLEISNNGALKSLDGLQAFRSVQSNLEVFNNAQLSKCGAIHRLVDAVDDAAPGPGPGAGGVPDVGGQVTLSGNQLGCNAISQLEPIHADGFE